ncbi:MAG: lamin tail domain-containing protein [Candidatus Pacebacteria bacterium]|nr:lamin tail domain-containing protein [Candidatus Paceibacterota bacterium]
MTIRSFAHLIIGIAIGSFPLAAYADLRITEVMYDPDGADGKREWIEIFNEGPYLEDLANYKFVDKSGHVLNVPPKNGGTGTMVIVPGAYAVLASDATTFHSMFSRVNQVIDTTMSLNNTGATIGMTSVKGSAARAVYEKTMGAAGTGESLQWHEGAWLHALPTPGRENAKVSTVAAPKIVPVVEKPPEVKKSTSRAGSASIASAKADAEISGDDPADIVNATPTDVVAQTASAGSLGGSMWWFAAAALALSTGAAASMISRTKKKEWSIEESE